MELFVATSIFFICLKCDRTIPFVIGMHFNRYGFTQVIQCYLYRPLNPSQAVVSTIKPPLRSLHLRKALAFSSHTSASSSTRRLKLTAETTSQQAYKSPAPSDFARHPKFDSHTAASPATHTSLDLSYPSVSCLPRWLEPAVAARKPTRSLLGVPWSGNVLTCLSIGL